jgi:outer membrane protein assembly factor BamB
VIVTADVPIIDLDLQPPVRDREPPPLRRRLVPPRPVLLVVVLLAVLTSLTSARPPRPVLRPVLSAGGQPAAAFELADGAMFTASFGNNPNSESGVRRWDLITGGLSWAVALPQNVQNLVYDDTARVLMARSAAEPKVAFLDADTGETLWENHEPNTSVYTLSHGRALFATDLTADVRELRLFDTRTGRQLWRRDVDGSGYFSAGQDEGAEPTRVIAVDRVGHAVVLRFADGAVQAQGELGVDLSEQYADYSDPDVARAGEAGDSIYISRREHGVATLTAWSLGTLTRRWQTTGGPVGFVGDCGPVLCLGLDDAIDALDPADGRLLWHRDGYGLTIPYGRGTLLAYGPGDLPQADLLDPATGRVRERLGASIGLEGVLLRGDTVQLGRTWVQVPGPDGALHVVGSMDTAAPYGCDLRGAYLACPTSAGPTQIWLVPRHVS